MSTFVPQIIRKSLILKGTWERNAPLMFFVVFFVWMSSVGSAEVIYQQTFPESGWTPLDGETPGTSSGASWSVMATNGGNSMEGGGIPENEGDSGWFADGTYRGTASSVFAAAYLPFVPQPGNIYTLSVTLSKIDSAAGTGGWLALGFAADADGLSNSMGPWLAISSDRSSVTTYRNSASGSGGNTESAVVSTDSPATLKIILDTTTTPFWSASYYSNNILRTVTYDAEHPNPAINYVVIAGYKGVVSKLSSFELSSEKIPSKP